MTEIVDLAAERQRRRFGDAFADRFVARLVASRPGLNPDDPTTRQILDQIREALSHATPRKPGTPAA